MLGNGQLMTFNDNTNRAYIGSYFSPTTDHTMSVYMVNADNGEVAAYRSFTDGGASIPLQGLLYVEEYDEVAVYTSNAFAFLDSTDLRLV